mmetsp:Transcript_7562/g.14741  ORF Transcript_7562/g.14741 Transcript_7562/m.14741 type:complete len:201 (-) Transcript_7562:260-862(-)
MVKVGNPLRIVSFLRLKRPVSQWMGMTMTPSPCLMNRASKNLAGTLNSNPKRKRVREPTGQVASLLLRLNLNPMKVIPNGAPKIGKTGLEGRTQSHEKLQTDHHDHTPIRIKIGTVMWILIMMKKDQKGPEESNSQSNIQTEQCKRKSQTLSPSHTSIVPRKVTLILIQKICVREFERSNSVSHHHLYRCLDQTWISIRR